MFRSVFTAESAIFGPYMLGVRVPWLEIGVITIQTWAGWVKVDPGKVAKTLLAAELAAFTAERAVDGKGGLL